MKVNNFKKKHYPFLCQKLEDDKRAFLGVEYVVELEDPTKQFPSYICRLCDKSCDSNNIISHLISFKHRENFLQLHFPILFASLQKIPNYRLDVIYKSKSLNKISRTIEYHCGRMRPNIYNVNTFNSFKNLINEGIKNFPHFAEKNFIKHEEKLLKKIREGIFKEQDEEKIHIGRKKKKLTKFERNDKRRDEQRKLERIRRLKDIRQHQRSLTHRVENKIRKLSLTPPGVISDADTLTFDSSDENIEKCQRSEFSRDDEI